MHHLTITAFTLETVKQRAAGLVIVSVILSTFGQAAFYPLAAEAEEQAPACGGQTATIWVTSDGKIVGSIMNGMTYAGVLNGTSGNDVIVGTANVDVMNGNDGDDVLCGLGGDDVQSGGGGNDILYGGDGNDILNDFSGTNQLYADDGSTPTSGGITDIPGLPSNQSSSSSSSSSAAASAGSVQSGTQTSGASSVSSTPTSGASSAASSTAPPQVVTLPGTPELLTLETLTVEDIPTVAELALAAGIPLCDGLPATYYIDAQGWIVKDGQRDSFYRGRLRGGNGPDVIVGTDGPDEIIGGGDNDVICGLGGNDSLDGSAGNDRVFGGSGRDTIAGGNGDDELCGDDQDDTIDGGIGNDTLCGGAGNDTLVGGIGNDKLAGGDGTDRLDGTIGNDECASGEDLQSCDTTVSDMPLCLPKPQTPVATTPDEEEQAVEDDELPNPDDLSNEADDDLATSGDTIETPVTPKKPKIIFIGVPLATGYRIKTQKAYTNPLSFARLFREFTIEGNLGSRSEDNKAQNAARADSLPTFRIPVISYQKTRPIARGTPFTGREKRLICSLIKWENQDGTETLLNNESALAPFAKSLGRDKADLGLALQDPLFCEDIPGSVARVDEEQQENVPLAAFGGDQDLTAGEDIIVLHVDSEGFPYLEGDSKVIKVWNNCVRNTITYRPDGRNYACERYREASSKWFGHKWLHPTLGIPLFGFNYRFSQLFIPESISGAASVVVRPADQDTALDEENIE